MLLRGAYPYQLRRCWKNAGDGVERSLQFKCSALTLFGTGIGISGHMTSITASEIVRNETAE